MKIRVIYGAFLLQYGIDEWVSKQRISSWGSQRCATNQMGISLGTSYFSESSYFFCGVLAMKSFRSVRRLRADI